MLQVGLLELLADVLGLCNTALYKGTCSQVALRCGQIRVEAAESKGVTNSFALPRIHAAGSAVVAVVRPAVAESRAMLIESSRVLTIILLVTLASAYYKEPLCAERVTNSGTALD